MAQIPQSCYWNDFKITLIYALRIEHDAIKALLDKNYKTNGFFYIEQRLGITTLIL